MLEDLISSNKYCLSGKTSTFASVLDDIFLSARQNYLVVPALALITMLAGDGCINWLVEAGLGFDYEEEYKQLK